MLSLGPTFNLKRLGAHDTGTRILAAYVKAQTAPDDYVFGDDPTINFCAERLCPPRLVDVSGAMTKSGQITAADVLNDCERYSVKLVFVEKGHSAHHLKNLKDFPVFESYLKERYEFVKSIRREFLEVDIYKSRQLPAEDEDPGKFPMFGIPREEVVSFFRSRGDDVIRIEEDEHSGREWVGYRYFVRKNF